MTSVKQILPNTVTLQRIADIEAKLTVALNDQLEAEAENTRLRALLARVADETYVIESCDNEDCIVIPNGLWMTIVNEVTIDK